jgi:hypothetical protein
MVLGDEVGELGDEVERLLGVLLVNDLDAVTCVHEHPAADLGLGHEVERDLTRDAQDLDLAEVALAVEGTSVKTQDGNREEDAVVDAADVTPSLEFDEECESLGLESGAEQVPETPEMSIESDEGADEDVGLCQIKR